MGLDKSEDPDGILSYSAGSQTLGKEANLNLCFLTCVIYQGLHNELYRNRPQVWA